MPGISIRLVEENIVSGRPGEQTMLKGYLPSDHVLVTFSPFPGTAWKARWTSSANTGPILLPPGTTKSIEVEIHPQAQYSTGKDGYYYIDVGLPSFYPNEMRQPDQGVEDAEYVTGCFNHSVPEFYGISPGADCRIWDCTGAWTLDEYQLSDVHPHHSCTLTHAKGPY